MLKNITIGQFLPGDSFIHRLDPRMKVFLTVLLITSVLLSDSPAAYIFVIIFISICFISSKIPFSFLFRPLKALIPLVIFTMILNLFFISGKEPLLSFYFIKIYKEGIIISVTMIVRIFCLIASGSLLTYTTSPISLTDAIEQILSPLKVIRFPSHELAMMMSIALRFIPTLMEETEKIISAQKARGADFETGGLIRRAKSLIPIFIPLFVSAFRRADELALAMTCRCYTGGEGRSRLRVLKYGYRDLLGLLGMSAATAAVVLLNWVSSSGMLNIAL